MRNFSFHWRVLGLLALLLLARLVSHAHNGSIGTTTPTQKLDGNGTLRLRGLSGSGNRLPVVQPDGTLGMNMPVYSTPTTATAVQAASADTGGGPTDMAVSGTTAYVVNQGSATLQTFNVSNPAPGTTWRAGATQNHMYML